MRGKTWEKTKRLVLGSFERAQFIYKFFVSLMQDMLGEAFWSNTVRHDIRYIICHMYSLYI